MGKDNKFHVQNYSNIETSITRVIKLVVPGKSMNCTMYDQTTRLEFSKKLSKMFCVCIIFCYGLL